MYGEMGSSNLQQRSFPMLSVLITLKNLLVLTKGRTARYFEYLLPSKFLACMGKSKILLPYINMQIHNLFRKNRNDLNLVLFICNIAAFSLSGFCIKKWMSIQKWSDNQVSLIFVTLNLVENQFLIYYISMPYYPEQKFKNILLL